jgi:DNA sulfur modification protein DndB
MGSTDYYQASVRAQDLAGVAITAGELREWHQWSLVERFQRELAYSRIRNEIVPYLVKSRDRFFGSLIVLIYQPETFAFDSVSEMGLHPGRAYADAAARMGFLTIGGGKLVVLDGQHRLAALREVVQGGPNSEGPYRDAIADDHLSVVFIRHESLEKTRRVFNKVNRYARPTSPTDNIITSEDDGYAIVSRWLIEPEAPLDLKSPLPPLCHSYRDESLVEWRSTQLKPDDIRLTTLQTVYQTVEAILDAHGITHFDERHRVNRPSEAELRKAYIHAAAWWDSVILGIPGFSQAVRHPYLIPDPRRRGEKWSLLFRPVGQVALFRGLAEAHGLGVQLDQAIERARRINWRSDAPMWFDTIIRQNGRMVVKQRNVRLAARLIAYLIAADAMRPSEVDRLVHDYAEAQGRRSALPRPVSP